METVVWNSELDPYLLAELCPLTSPSFQSILGLCHSVTLLLCVKTINGPALPIDESLKSLVWYSELHLSCFTLSFYPPSQVPHWAP